MSVAATRRSRMETWYRRLLALYPKDHRREHAEEMVGVLLAADGAAQVRAPKPVPGRCASVSTPPTAPTSSAARCGSAAGSR